MAPAPLHDMNDIDLRALNRVFEALVAYKKVRPVLEVIVNATWTNRRRAAPYLKDCLAPRSEARSMKASDEWDVFWINLD